MLGVEIWSADWIRLGIYLSTKVFCLINSDSVFSLDLKIQIRRISTESHTQISQWTFYLLQNKLYGWLSSWLYTLYWICNETWHQWKDWARIFNWILFMIWDWFNTGPLYGKYNIFIKTHVNYFDSLNAFLIRIVNACTLVSISATYSSTYFQNDCLPVMIYKLKHLHNIWNSIYKSYLMVYS